MASRRTQVRSVIDSIPSTELLDVSKESLQSLTESNLAAVDVWASNGNIRQVRQAGTGLVALCAWFAMKALTEDADARAFQRASGLAPSQFTSSSNDLAPAMQSERRRTFEKIQFSTPTKNTAQFALPTMSPAERTPEALAQRAKDVVSGALFKKSPASNPHESPSHGTSPHKLRDRRSIRERTIYDPSPDVTPTKRRKLTPLTSRNDLDSPSKKHARIEKAYSAQSADVPSLNSPTVVTLRDLEIETLSHTSTGVPDYPFTLGPAPPKDAWNREEALERIRSSLSFVLDLRSKLKNTR